MSENPTPETVLEVEDLFVAYRSSESVIPAAKAVTFDLRAGEILALVGESASGKSTVGHAILGLLPGSAAMSGHVRYRGRSIESLPSDEMQRLRGREIAVIFQDAMAALTPTMTVGEQMAEPFRAHLGLTPDEAYERARQALAEVMPNADRVLDSYPFQLSGGMAQRVMIAMATELKPSVVIADEPTANLDPAVRNEMLEWLESLRAQGTALLVITHDFGVVARLADRVAVMYAGQLVEVADVRTTFRTPKHPYTFGLLGSLPSLAPRGRLRPMPGNPPDLATLPPECPFLPRCNKATAECRTEPAPSLMPVEGSPGHFAACFNPMAVPFRE
jgi:oligopeptide/dipeptide ABC transporter ATP-binding protein